MSHFTRVKTTFRNKDLLIRCLREMGLGVDEGGTVSSYGTTQKVDIVVHVPGARDIGFIRGSDGSYDISADWYGVRGVSQASFQADVEARRVVVENKIQQEAEDRRRKEEAERARREMEAKIKKEMEEIQRKARHQYALQTTMAKLKAQGFQVVEQRTDPNGAVRLLARRWR